MKYDFSEPKESRVFPFFRPLAKAFINLKFNLTAFGKENIPKSGAFILAANHIGALDPVMIISNCPRTLHFMAKEELFRNRFFALFFKNMNVFPVRRQTGDKRALEFSQKILANGWALGIFPEGSRSKDGTPKKAKNGIAYIAAKTGADILPVSIYKTPGEQRFRPKITLRFGTVIKSSALGLEKNCSPQKLKEAGEAVMNKITAMWQLKHGETT